MSRPASDQRVALSGGFCDDAPMSSADTDDTRFLTDLAGHLHALPGVEAVTLGGSRAEGTHRVDSDWDLALYYRSGFDPQDLSALGWDGKVSGIGEWGGVFNGGAWLRVHGRPVDVHYRDLGVVEHEIAEAEQGRFRVEPLMFHLAGIPTYLLLAELALGQVLHGELPRPGYPEALRAHAPGVWRGFAAANLSYAEHNHAPYGRVTQCAGLLAQAAAQAAHGVCAAKGEWVTNDKTLLSKAGLEEMDLIIAGMTGDPDDLRAAVAEANRLVATA